MAPIPSVPVSWGELLDKISILEIKQGRMPSAAATAHVERELDLLRSIAADASDIAEVAPLLARLRRINETLWEIEDAIRELEGQASFGPAFIALARTVYQTNDTRAALKRQINLLLASELIEEKSYVPTLAADPLADDPLIPPHLDQG